MEYYSALTRNDILIHVTTWVRIENIMLNQTWKGTSYDSTSRRYLELANSKRQKVGQKLPRAAGRKNRELLFNGYRIGDDEKVLETDSRDGRTMI